MEIPWQKRKKLKHIQLDWVEFRNEKKNCVHRTVFMWSVLRYVWLFHSSRFFPSRFEQPRFTSANNIALDAVPLSCLFITYLHSLWCMLNIAQAPLVTVNTNNSGGKAHFSTRNAQRALCILVYSAYTVHVQLLCLCIIIKSMNAVAFPLYLIMNQWMEVE